MNVSDCDEIVSVLQQNDGEYIMVKIPGEDKYATSPVGDAYMVMCNARMLPVLNNIDGFIRKQFYPNVKETLSSEWGAINNLRFFISSQGSISANASLLGNDIANCFVSAKEGYKVVWQAGGKAKFIYIPPGYNNDPCIKTNLNVHVKSLLIDLEAYGESYGDRGQAGNSVQPERLSEETLFWDATVRSILRKVLKLAEMINSLARGVTKWLRHTAGCQFYQGLEDLALNKSSLIEVELCNADNTAQAGRYALAA